MYNLTKGLLDLGNNIKVLAINTPKNGSPPPSLSDKQATTPVGWGGAVETVYIDTSLKVWDAFANLFSSESYHIKRFISKDFEKKLIEILKDDKFDVIQLESLFVTPYINCIRKNSNAKVVLRAHNVEFEIWERMTAVCKNPVKKAYLKLLTKRLRQYELNQLNSYDGLAAITHRDVDIFKKLGCKVPITDIPVGVDILDTLNQQSIPSLFHLGSMDWMPNQEAIKWFLEFVWKHVHHKYPDLKFYIAGRNMPKWLKNIKYKNVEIVSEAVDAKQFMSSKSIMIVPLLSGSGMRVKIIEGMALRKTIISTSIGAEGIKCEHLKNILIANSPDEFLEMIGKCVNDKSLCDKIGENARLLIEEHYNNTKIAKKLIDFYKTL